MTDWLVIPDAANHTKGQLVGPEFSIPCSLGKNGLITAEDKVEGDGKSPVGSWPVRYIFYRPDKENHPASTLPVTALLPTMGWCDAPEDSAYNQLVKHPWRSSAEHLWRDDDVYDLILVLGYNDDPIIPRKGSAIFLHIARDDFSPTQGCVAIKREDMRALSALLSIGDHIVIKAPSL